MQFVRCEVVGAALRCRVRSFQNQRRRGQVVGGIGRAGETAPSTALRTGVADEVEDIRTEGVQFVQ